MLTGAAPWIQGFQTVHSGWELSWDFPSLFSSACCLYKYISIHLCFFFTCVIFLMRIRIQNILSSSTSQQNPSKNVENCKAKMSAGLRSCLPPPLLALAVCCLRYPEPAAGGDGSHTMPGLTFLQRCRVQHRETKSQPRRAISCGFTGMPLPSSQAGGECLAQPTSSQIHA